MSDDRFPTRLSKRLIYQSPWIELYADTVRMPDGSVIEAYHRLHYPSDAVCVAVFNRRDELLMIRSRRYITGRLEWELPAGSVEKDETPIEAAWRECLEETGCRVENLRFLCSQNPSNGMADLTVHVFAARAADDTGSFDQNEVAERRWIPRPQLMRMLRRNELRCGVSMLAALYALQFYLEP
ncbi:MAG: NUDIX hydrolase [Clostridiales bacterium]|nr:NUDIX hydrolase [Clostridiales bacterium]